MAVRGHPNSARRIVVGAAAVALVVALGVLVWLARTPGVAEACATVLELSARAGEAPGAAERSACERHYAGRQRALGWVAWARLARCTATARTMSDAGGCPGL